MELVFILVAPARAENIGAAARALKTMGFNQLRLVDAEISAEAGWVAHQSGDILQKATHYPDLNAALADVDLAVATTARRRMQRDRYLTPRQLADNLTARQSSLQRVALVFGRESSGLTGEEIAACQLASYVPLKVEQPSLNLGQAVMLYAWELSATATAAKSRPAAQTFTRAQTLLDEGLDSLGLNRHPNLAHWARETLALADDRDLGMLMQILRRLQQRR
jgi:tRNA/rRNA methyltransferase